MVDYTEAGYLKETGENEVVHTICMGLTEKTPAGFPDAGAQTPMGADIAEKLPPGMSLCLGINPYTLSERSLSETEDQITSGASRAGGASGASRAGGASRAVGAGGAGRAGKIVGIKIYAGYYHVDINDPVYDPVYKLAEKHDLTIAVHTGDIYSSRGLLKYSHPLNIDDLAVAHPMLRIVACHMGVPWVFDACEVAVKNANVYLDISGILTACAESISLQSSNPLLIDRYRQALAYLDNYDKVLYGTDWPLAPMGAYIDFCKKLIPPEAYDKVFYQNAIDVYRLVL